MLKKIQDIYCLSMRLPLFEILSFLVHWILFGLDEPNCLRIPRYIIRVFYINLIPNLVLSESWRKTSRMEEIGEPKRKPAEFVKHGSSSIHHLSAFGYPSRPVIPLWTWYNPVTQTEVEDWHKKLYPSLWPTGPTDKATEPSEVHATHCRVVIKCWAHAIRIKLNLLDTQYGPSPRVSYAAYGWFGIRA